MRRTISWPGVATTSGRHWLPASCSRYRSSHLTLKKKANKHISQNVTGLICDFVLRLMSAADLQHFMFVKIRAAQLIAI